MKQLRFVILIMLIMLLLCPAARAARTLGSAQTQQMRKPPAVQEVFSYVSMLRTDPRPRSRVGLPAETGCAGTSSCI